MPRLKATIWRAPRNTLEIQILEVPNLYRSVRVLPDGRFIFPFVGPVRAAGLTITEIDRNLARRIFSNFAASPNVFVSAVPEEREPLEPGTINVFPLGKFEEPELTETPPGKTILHALSTGGGMTRFAVVKRVCNCAALTQPPITSDKKAETVISALTAILNQELTNLSEFDIIFIVLDSDERSDGGDDFRRYGLELEYRYYLAQDWSLVGRFSTVLIEEDISANTIFIGLEKRVAWN